MAHFLVTWLDGRFESYPSVASWSIAEGTLSLRYHEETYLIPLSGVRTIKMEQA